MFLPSCSFLFQAPMPAHVAQSTAEPHSTHRRAQKRTCSLERSCVNKSKGVPQTPHHPQTTSAVDERSEFQTMRGDVPLLTGTPALGASTL